MQKLVTIYVDNKRYFTKPSTWQPPKHDDSVPRVEEHLQDYLSAGWRITSMEAFGGSGDHYMTLSGWIAVVLELDD